MVARIGVGDCRDDLNDFSFRIPGLTTKAVLLQKSLHEGLHTLSGTAGDGCCLTPRIQPQELCPGTNCFRQVPPRHVAIAGFACSKIIPLADTACGGVEAVIKYVVEHFRQNLAGIGDQSGFPALFLQEQQAFPGQTHKFQSVTGVGEDHFAIFPTAALCIQRFHKVPHLHFCMLTVVHMIIQNETDEFFRCIRPLAVFRLCTKHICQPAQSDHPGALREFSGDIFHFVFGVKTLLVGAESLFPDGLQNFMEQSFPCIPIRLIVQNSACGKNAFAVKTVAVIAGRRFLLEKGFSFRRHGKGQLTMVDFPEAFHFCRHDPEHIFQPCRQFRIAVGPEIADMLGQTFQPAPLDPGIHALFSAERFIVFAEVPAGNNVKFGVDKGIAAPFKTVGDHGHGVRKNTVDLRFPVIHHLFLYCIAAGCEKPDRG